MPGNAGQRVVLIDRDGVLNVDRPDYVKTLDELQVERNAGEGIAALTAAGFTCVVITNQACVGKGLITRGQLDAIHAELFRRLAAAGGRIAGVFLCPHHPDEDCACRKPKPGLIDQAHAVHGFDRGTTWMIGDAARDVQCAVAAGCRAALVRTGKGEREAAKVPGTPLYADLLDFARALIAGTVPATTR